jgi:hypothetical protein
LRSAAHTARAPSMGFRHCPLRDIGQRRPLVTGAPTLRPDGPTSAFRTPSSVCSVPGLAGLFHPAAAYRVSLQGFVPRREPYRVSTALALVPFGAFPTASHLSVRRAAGCSCGFRALLSRRVRWLVETGESPAATRPSWVFLLRVSGLPSLRAVSRPGRPRR